MDDDTEEQLHEHIDVSLLFPYKETIDDVRARFLKSFKWLDKAVAVVRSKQPHEIDLSFWMNEDRTVGCPASWCGLDPEFQAESFVYRLPKTYQPAPAQEMPTFSVRGNEVIGAAAIAECFEMYGINNGNIPWYHLFGYPGESKYDDLLEGDPDQEIFIQRVGLYKKEMQFLFEEHYGTALFVKQEPESEDGKIDAT